MKIAVIDDDPMVLRFVGEALRRRPEVESVVLFDSAAAAETTLGSEPVDLLLVDVHLRGECGIECIARSSARRLGLKIVALSVSKEPWDIDRALRAGAQGYLLKGECLDDFVDQIVERRLEGSRPLLSPSVLRHLVSCLRSEAAMVRGVTGLTVAEKRVLELTAEGLSCKEIADRLLISVGTVYVHNRRILKKLGVRTRVAAAARFRTQTS